MNHIKRIIFSTLLLMIGFTVSFAQQVTQQQKTVTGTIKDADISLSKQIIMTFL